MPIEPSKHVISCHCHVLADMAACALRREPNEPGEDPVRAIRSRSANRVGNCVRIASRSPRKHRRFQTIFQDVDGNVHMLFHGYQWQGLWTGMHAYSKDLTTCALALPPLHVNVGRRDELAL